MSGKWTEKEDICLVSAMISVGTDARIGTSQRKANFWVRVLNLWNEYRVENPEMPERVPDTLRCRWNRIRPKINKWVAAHSEASRCVRSGMSGDDLTRMAHSFYKRDNHGNDFDCMHIWDVLRNFDKWSVLPGMNPQETARDENRQCEESSHSSKRSRDEGPELQPDEDDFYVPLSETPRSPTPFSAAMEDTEPTDARMEERPQSQRRPRGREAAKKARGKDVGESSASTHYSQFTQEVKDLSISQAEVAEIARKRLELDERRLQEDREERQRRLQEEREERQLKRKHETLIVLLGKSSLSPAEEAIKQKLLTELYGN